MAAMAETAACHLLNTAAFCYTPRMNLSSEPDWLPRAPASRCFRFEIEQEEIDV